MSPNPNPNAAEQPATPIDPGDSMAVQSRQALMIADNLGLLVYRMPVDMTNKEQVATVVGELGDEAKLPNDTIGVYYFLYVPTNHDERVPVLLAEGEVRSFVLGLALCKARAMAELFVYRLSLFPA